MAAHKTARAIVAIERILLGELPKEISHDLGISVCAIGQILNNNGIKKYWLAEYEWDEVIARRRKRRQ